MKIINVLNAMDKIERIKEVLESGIRPDMIEDISRIVYEPEKVPFDANDWKLFMGKSIARKDKKFKGETWKCVGLDSSSILIQDNVEVDYDTCWKSFKTLFDEFEFLDGRVFGK